MPDPTILPAAVPDAAPPAPRNAPPRNVMARGVAGVAIGAAVVGGVFALNTVTLPAFVGTHGVALAIAAVGGVTAVRWVRRGVRRQLKDSAAAQVAEFGGGLYGALAFATLLYLEVIDLAGDLASAGSAGAFFRGMDFEWLMGQMMESIGFAIRAGMWPWYWFAEMGPMVAALVAGGVWALHGVLPRLWRGRAVADAEQTP
jgi:hypothetical protein